MKFRVIVALVAAMGLVGACVPEPGTGVPQTGVDCGPPPQLTSGADLAGCILAGLDLSGMNLDGANLAGADLSGADLSGASLVQANLEGANLTGADLTGADLSGAILAGSILLGALFINAILNGTSFDFGAVYGNDGLGGTTAQADLSCVGEFCPGYNSANNNFEDYACDPLLDQVTGFFVTRTEDQLKLARSRSVVTDASTDFTGASFHNEDGELLIRGLDVRDANFTSTSWNDVIFGCKSLDGARFNDAQLTEAEFHHVSALDADFSGAHFFTAWFCDADFTGSEFQDTTWEGFVGFSCADFIPGEELDLLPDPLVRFDDTDWTDSVMGGVEDPERGTLWAMTYAFEGRTFSASFQGAILDGIHVTDGLYWKADLRGSRAIGATFVGNSQFNDVLFSQDDQWDQTTWMGNPVFDGAECPDGTIGSNANPCFSVTP